MRKLILLVHTSLDGFVAGENGGFENFKPGKDNLEFVCSLTEQADAALVGRISYQLLNAHWPTAHQKPDATKDEIKYSQWYNNAEKIVISKTLTEANLTNTTVIGKDLESKLTKVKQKAGKNILMFGSPSAFQSLFQLGLIDEYWCIL
jgi:dihydrofolate reductase